VEWKISYGIRSIFQEALTNPWKHIRKSVTDAKTLVDSIIERDLNVQNSVMQGIAEQSQLADFDTVGALNIKQHSGTNSSVTRSLCVK
jgi:hypothetical protein